MQPKNTGVKLFQIIMIATLSIAASCGASTKEKKGSLTDKKVELEKLKAQQSKIGEQITKLESEILKEDPTAISKPKLVSIAEVSSKNFAHYIDLQGRVDAEDIVYVAPRAQGGQVKAVYVKQGDYVKKGQLLLKLDDAVARQQVEQAKVQLDLAKSTYERRKNLWDQKIGSEQEFLVAKTSVESQEKQIDLLKEQLDMANVYAEMPGIADMVTVKVGDVFTPASANPQATALSGIRIVNSSNLKVVVDIPENYLSRVKRGTPVLIDIPDLNKTFNSTIFNISQVINTTSRGFLAEAKLPSGQNVKPNTVTMVHIQDYTANNAITIPMNAVQTDQDGKYVYLMVVENGKTIARKRPVVVGELSGDQIEIKTGLSSGDKLISEGYQSVYDGQLVTTGAK